jgi:Tfp pilus assembly protein PilN
MKPVRVDFAPPSLQRAVLRAPAGVWLLLVAGLALSASAGYAWVAHRQLDNSRHAEQLRAKSVRETGVAPTLRPAISVAQAAAINKAVLQLNLPWPALRSALSTATPANVALLALEPDAPLRTLKIVAETKNSSDMFAYIALLKRQAIFQQVLLSKHELDEQDSNRPIRFQIEVVWTAPGAAS